MTPDEDDFCWGALAARVLHPVQVQIIEALRWIDRPLSAGELLRVLRGEQAGLRIEHHLRRLRRLGAVALDGKATARIAATDRSYRLVRRPRP
jgi:Helix-turn-helix domain